MRVSPLLRIAADPVARIWGGVNSLIIPPDWVEPQEATYLGGGALLNIPDLEQVVNGTASRIEITVSGVSAQTLKLATEEAASVKGAPCHVGLVYFDDAWQILEVEWLATLRADLLTTANQQAQGGRSRSITISISTEDTDRSRSPSAWWTDADQARLSPTDRFFDHIAGISAGTSRRFGPND